MGRKNVIEKQTIIDESYNLILEKGLDGFSARKLAVKLNIAPMTLYNYFSKLDSILIEVINKGFFILSENFSEYVKQKNVPEKEPLYIYYLQTEVALNFAQTNYNIYNLMFTANIPFVLNDELTKSHYSNNFTAIESKFPPVNIPEIHKTIYLYEVLSNALILNHLNNRNKVDRNKFSDLNQVSYEKLLNPFNKLAVPAGL